MPVPHVLSWSLLIAVAVCALSILVPYLPLENKERDAKFYQPLPDIALSKEFHRSGTVEVTHSEATLLEVADSQGPSPGESVAIAYHTSYSKEKSECDERKHLLLVHGTGFNKDTFHWTGRLLKASGHDSVASVLSPQLESRSIVDRLHAEPGVCVTTIDLRGHGGSSVTAGPWSVRLLAADMAEALTLIHGNDVKVHAHGHSVGYGVVLSIAFNYPHLLWTVGGSGFLADLGSTNSWLAYIYTRESVVNLLGMESMGTAAASSILVSTAKDFVKEIFRFVKLRGYLHTSQSWLNYNEADMLSTMKVPVLWQHPIKDDLCGYTVESVENEFNQLPTSNGNKLIVYDENGKEDHCYPLLDPDRFFGDLLDFVRRKS